MLYKGMVMSAGGEVAQGGVGGDDTSSTDVNLTEPKNGENPHG
jgi:hypothetical protein